MASGLILLAIGVATQSASAAPGEDDTPIDNPDLVAGCGIDVHMILDESGSVQPFTSDVRGAFRAFTGALANTGSRMAVSEFSTAARLPLPPAERREYTTITNETIDDVFDPYIQNNYNPNGSTHWEDAFRAGRYFLPRPTQIQPHLTVFVTDGDPNRVVREDRVTYDPGNTNISQNEYELKIPLSDNDETSSANENDASDRAVPNANAVKATGSHILTVAVGAGLDSSSSLDRIIDVSGPDVFDGSGTFDITTDDVFRVEDFDELEDAMREAAFGLCAPSITVRKLIDITPDPGTNDLIPGEDWELTATVDPPPADWVLPSNGAGNTAVAATGAGGFTTFQWTMDTDDESSVEILEEDPGGVGPPPGFVNARPETECTVRTPDEPDSAPLDLDVVNRGFTAEVPFEAIVTCRLVNRALPRPSITLRKATNGADADDPPGPFVPEGDDVTWTYVATNTGNVTLSDVEVTDDQDVEVRCPDDEIPPGEEMRCTAKGTADAGLYSNIGSVTAVDPFETEVEASDPSHYTGAAPGIDVEKSTNTRDADNAPGPFIPPGAPVTWEYVVTNTGNTPIIDVDLTDSEGVVPAFAGGDTDGDDELDNNETWTYEATDTADPGQYENVATVEGEDPLGTTVQDSDPSHYFGANPMIDIEKSTNGEDADTAPGPLVGVGDPVDWTYTVTNTGNLPLTFEVTDDQLSGGIRCPRLILVPGRTVQCSASAPGGAEPDQYENLATVEGTTLDSGQVVDDSDPSHYFGVEGAINLEKLTNNIDADQPPGPSIPVGDVVTWTYRVTNTGNSDLENVQVVDQTTGVDVCTLPVLAEGATEDCTANGFAEPEQYTNIATATGLTPVGGRVADFDPSHYFGAEPGINLEKLTNGVDADDPPGPFIPVGEPVTWTYQVTNTGNNPLSGITITDDQGVAVTCPDDELAALEQMTCTGTGTAETGDYENGATATGLDTAQTSVSDDDPSHYFGSVSEIHIEKSTNGRDADDPPGPLVPVGNRVLWRYEVTNPGNIPIREVRVADSREDRPQFAGGDDDSDGELDPPETWIYRTGAKATSGQYRNVGTATGMDVFENDVRDRDPSHYRGGEPELTIRKQASKRDVKPGQVISYTITVRNKGPVAALDVVVCDELPKEQHLLRTNPQATRSSDHRACWEIRRLGPGQSKTFRLVVQVDDSSPPGTQRNVAVIDGEETDNANVHVLPTGSNCPRRGAPRPFSPARLFADPAALRC